MREIVDRLRRERNLPRAQMRDLLLCEDAAALEYLHAQARAVREEAYGREPFSSTSMPVINGERIAPIGPG